MTRSLICSLVALCTYATAHQPRTLSRHLRVDLVWDGDQRQHVEIQRAAAPDGPFKTICAGERRIPVYSDFLGEARRAWYYRMRPLKPEDSPWSPVVQGVSRQSTIEQLLTEVQEASFRYFWDYGHPVSGLAREGSSRNPALCTIGASGMGLFNLGVGVERGFVTREQAAERALKILRFLAEKAHRYRGAYSHWLNGETGKFIRFGKQNDGADLVETAFLAQGFLFLREYFDRPGPAEQAIRALADRLWRGIEWDHFAGRRGNRFVLNWHWYSKQDPKRRMVVSGFNEAEIVYLLAMGSPTHAVGPEYYHTGWKHRWYSRPREQFGIPIELNRGVGPPIFFLHYSYLGFDPRANKLNGRTYFDHFRDICRIHVKYAASRSADFKGYGPLWGLTASYDPDGYSTHHPGTKKDNGTITPTAALSSMPYLPEAAISCMKTMYEQYGAQIWDEFGSRDAFNPTRDWVARGVLGIDIGPIAPMIENHRTGLCWRVFMKAPEMREALAKLRAKPAAVENDGTADEVATLNVKSKLPFVDRSKFLSRGVITYRVPEARDDGLEVGDARELGDLTQILKLLNDIEKKNQAFRVGKGAKRKSQGPHGPRVEGCIDSVLIAKNGKLIIEEYFADARIDRPHYQMSITKSMVAYAIGKAIELGKIKSENDLILDYLPEVDRSKVAAGVEKLTLRDLLTMHSGLRVERGRKLGKITRDNHAELYLTRTQPVPDKKPHKYDGANVDILVHVLYNTTGMTLGEFCGKHLFGPLGITRYKFGKSICGLDKGAAGMALTSRDMMKIGLMTMHRGIWRGRQILSPAWIEKATAALVNRDAPHQYGYFWWSHKITIAGKEYRVRSARGAGGQFIFMLPELDLAAVFTSYYATNVPIQHFGKIIVPTFVK